MYRKQVNDADKSVNNDSVHATVWTTFDTRLQKLSIAALISFLREGSLCYELVFLSVVDSGIHSHHVCAFSNVIRDCDDFVCVWGYSLLMYYL